MKTLEENLYENLQKFLDNTEVDVDQLDSFSSWHHDQGLDRFAEPDDENWDEQEELDVKIRELNEKIKDNLDFGELLFDGLDNDDCTNEQFEELRVKAKKWVEEHSNC